MRIHKDIEPILFRYSQNFDRERYPFMIIFTRSSMLNRLPCEDVSYSVKAPPSESCEMLVCVFERKGSSHKRDAITFEEVFSNIRRNIWGLGVFSITRNIDSPDSDLPVMWIPECLAVDPESGRSHVSVGHIYIYSL